MTAYSRYPSEYIEFLAHFHGDRDFFECHELLEDYWKSHRNDKYSAAWLGLIQAAVGSYHWRRGNVRGAMKSISNALRNSDLTLLRELGIDSQRWLEALKELLAAVQANPETPYKDMSIPIVDPQLLAGCQQRCRELGFVWNSPSDLANRQLIHRHMLRDRSDVIAQRRKALELRVGGRLQEGSTRRFGHRS